MLNRNVVNIIGAGVAGIEAALFLAGHDIKVHIFDNGKMYREDKIKKRLTISEEMYTKLLTKELSLLGSPLAKKIDEFEKSGAKCLDQLLVSYGLKMINDNENIEVFEASVKTVNPMELTLIASGPYTEDALYNHLIEKYGTLKCVQALPIYPIIEDIDEAYLYHKEDNTYLLAISEEEYGVFVKEVVKQAVDERKSSENFKIQQNTIEDLALHNKDNLRSYAMKPQIMDGLKPYATLVLKRVEYGFEVQHLSSDLPQIRQYKIFSTLKALQHFKFVKVAGVCKGKFINPVYTTTPFCQSRQEENVFFAGGILGLDGSINGIASGMWTAMNILKRIENKKMIKVPIGCAFGKFIQNLTGESSTKTRPIIGYDEIIKIDADENLEEFVKVSFDKSLYALEQFKEEYKNGKYV